MRPDIFKYHDYLNFLRDWLAYRKASQSAFSLRSLAKQAELATGYLPMVLSGKRLLSQAALSKLIPFLELSASESAFLENLLVLGTTETHATRVAALERMKRFQQYQKQNPKETEVYEYLTHWYYVAIREMAALPGFQAEAKWIQSQLRFAVPLAEIKTALTFLLQNGYLEVSADGTVRPPQKSLDCSGGVYRIALAKFHHEILQLAAKSIENTPSEERNIVGHTCTLSPENFNQAQAILQEAIGKIRELGEGKQAGENVYHMEIALFPLTGAKRSAK